MGHRLFCVLSFVALLSVAVGAVWWSDVLWTLVVFGPLLAFAMTALSRERHRVRRYPRRRVHIRVARSNHWT